MDQKIFFQNAIGKQLAIFEYSYDILNEETFKLSADFAHLSHYRYCLVPKFPSASFVQAERTSLGILPYHKVRRHPTLHRIHPYPASCI